jgi:hypothetical protein
MTDDCLHMRTVNQNARVTVVTTGECSFCCSVVLVLVLSFHVLTSKILYQSRICMQFFLDFDK